MAKMKFYLNVEGEKLRTLEDLQNNFFADSVLEHYHSGKLARWLDVWGYANELAQVQAIQETSARGILAELGRIFDVEVELEDIDSDMSVNDFLDKCKNTDIPQPYEKGLAYYNGDGVEQDYLKAAECFRKAAEQGNAKAQLIIGIASMGWKHGLSGLRSEILGELDEGNVLDIIGNDEVFTIDTSLLGIAQNVEEGPEWIGKSAAQGYPWGQLVMGFIIMQENASEGLKLITQAAEQGNMPAILMLCAFYAEGDSDLGIEKDESKALPWIRKAAEQGNADAQNGLGLMYKNGYSVEQNEELAVEWFRKAANQGHADAQKNLGDMYCYGEGVEEDDQQALAWYRKAAAQGHKEAKDALSGLEGLIEMMNESSSSSSTSKSDVEDLAVSAAAGATVGAAVGSVIPIVGTAVGAAVGGLLGSIFGRDK